MAETNVPTAMYKFCMPTVVRLLETTALKLDSPNGRACVTLAASESDNISPVFTTASNINSSMKIRAGRQGTRESEKVRNEINENNIVLL